MDRIHLHELSLPKFRKRPPEPREGKSFMKPDWPTHDLCTPGNSYAARCALARVLILAARKVFRATALLCS
jgi:hypothetical protein